MVKPQNAEFFEAHSHVQPSKGHIPDILNTFRCAVRDDTVRELQ
jgi:hypothetical protein